MWINWFFKKLLVSIQLCLIDIKTQLAIKFFVCFVRVVYGHIPDTCLGEFYPSAEMQRMYSSATVDWSILYQVNNQLPTIIFLKVFNFISVIGFINTSVTFFSVLMYSKRINPSFISSRINWNFISIYFDLWWTTVFFFPKQYWTDYLNE